MLSYAFHVLKNKEYKKVETEYFEDATELFSEILFIALSKQIKQGLVRDYIDYTDTTSSVKGKINITESINSQSILKKRLNCVYDEFSLNFHLNQIIKSTLNILLKSDISRQRHKKLKRLMMYFNDVDLIDINSINWQIRYDRNNQSGVVTMKSCYADSNKGGNYHWPATGKPSALGYKVVVGKAIIDNCTSKNGRNDISGAILKGNCIGF